MDFKKDLLLVDLEMTGLDASRNEIIQLAAVLLDRKTLAEKENFNSFIRPRRWASRDKESMAVNNISFNQLKNAPDLKRVLRAFGRQFGHQVVLAYYGGPLDVDFLRLAHRSCGLPFKFDYHFFNLWGLFYAFLAKRNQLTNQKKFTGFAMEDLMKKFKIKSNRRHDALEDCRVEAEILRKIMRF